MDNIRIAVLSAYDEVRAFLDNEAPEAMHYYDDELHEYLKGQQAHIHSRRMRSTRNQ